MDFRIDFIFNINQSVKVKLRDIGIRELEKRHNNLHEWVKGRNGVGLDPFKLRLDDDGYYTTQLWILMEVFGHLIGMTSDPPFETDIIFMHGEPIKEKCEHRNVSHYNNGYHGVCRDCNEQIY